MICKIEQKQSRTSSVEHIPSQFWFSQFCMKICRIQHSKHQHHGSGDHPGHHLPGGLDHTSRVGRHKQSASHSPNQGPGARPAAQACALTGNRTCDFWVYRPVLSPLNYTGQGTILFVLQNWIVYKTGRPGVNISSPSPFCNDCSSCLTVGGNGMTLYS